MNNNDSYFGMGVKKPRFRKGKNFIKNRILMAALFGTNTKLSQLSDLLGVNTRSAYSWIYERNPSLKNQSKIAEILNFPETVLFYDHCGAEEIEIPFQTTLHQGFFGNKI
ncbi:helix-turn-helix domain-containing protein [Paenibacillus terrae]|uniref:HTH cro/C1-type domain-containing protein n=1 Tax=Paenibacillus terrae TaxID=159743 RepID=A0A0D7WVA3_9BACL|nr:helix-turn-helix transcriptional regulator [Paenibacillus terrae]KJD42648.1 hypothetical protein QD47_27050 [Paenibacillus terrae]